MFYNVRSLQGMDIIRTPLAVRDFLEVFDTSGHILYMDNDLGENQRAELTAVTPEIGGPESITQSIEGQATGNSTLSSIVIQQIEYA